MRLLKPTILFLTLSTSSAAFASSSVTNVTISGTTVTADVETSGTKVAELTLTFDSATNLTAANLGLSAQTISTTDPALLARMPGNSVLPVAGLAVMITVAPPASGGFSFDGEASIRVYTQQLHYTATTPLRLFSAPAGGTFEDITVALSSGSYRSDGRKGKFSDFLIVDDTRPTTAVIDAKLDRLEARIRAYRVNMSTTVFNALIAAFGEIRTAYTTSTPAAAIVKTEALVTLALASNLPDTWTAGSAGGNAEGEILAAAHTLIFSLQRLP